MNMIRVLHVVTCMDRAGQETLIMNLYRNLDRSKIQFDFLCTSICEGDYDAEIQSMGGIIHHLPKNKLNIPHLHNIEIVKKYRDFFNNHSEYKIVHLHNYHAYSVLIQLIGARLGNVKNIIVHSHNTNAPHPFIHKITRPLLKLFQIHKFACSEAAGNWMFGNDLKKVHIVKNGIEPLQFKFSNDDRIRLRKELNITDKKVILHIGRFNYQKNHKFLLQVFKGILKSLPNAHLLLVGRGELENEIKFLVKESNLLDNVSFLGVRDDIPALFSASDLLLFPSLFEGLGVVLIEAQASGINILTTTSIPQEAILGETITQLSLVNSKDWEQRACELLMDYERMDMSPVIKSANYDITEIAKQLLSFYNSIS